MFLNIGKSVVIPEEEIIGIFDLDSSSQSRITRDFLSSSEKNGKIMNAAEDIPNSFLLVKEKKKQVYLAQSTSKTLAKRIDQMQKERRSTWRKSMK